MLLFILILITLGFLLFNFVLSNNDYMHPAVIFHLVFLLYEIVCFSGVQSYAITLHLSTVLVLTVGFTIMTIVNLITHRYRGIRKERRVELKEIQIPSFYLYAVIILQLLSIIFFYVYLKRIAITYGESYGTAPTSISGMIKLFDTLTKFWTSTFKKMAVPIPMVYRITNPICAGAEYVVLYEMVNNFLIKKRKNFLLELFIFIFMCARILMNGSRSPLLRVFTFIFLLMYVLNYRRGKVKKGNLKFLGKLVLALGLFGIAMFLALIIMGRNDSSFTGIADHLFVYLGAPIVNLDTFLETNTIKLFEGINIKAPLGAQTFKGLYSYIGKWLHVIEFQNIAGIGKFAFSPNGREIGNVYTMFYKIIYDFGYIGVVPLTLLMSIYYCFTYRRVMTKPNVKRIIDFGLLVYAYLFNDLVMSPFSNRFYETVFDAVFVKFIIMAWLIDFFIVENKLRFKTPTRLVFIKHFHDFEILDKSTNTSL